MRVGEGSRSLGLVFVSLERCRRALLPEGGCCGLVAVFLPNINQNTQRV